MYNPCDSLMTLAEFSLSCCEIFILEGYAGRRGALLVKLLNFLKSYQLLHDFHKAM